MGTIKTHTRILGKALGLTIGGVDYWADTAGWELSAQKNDSDALTFADHAAGGKTFKRMLKVKAIQSTDPTSLHQQIEANLGKPLTVILAPHGNKTASTNQPHYTGTITPDIPPTLSSEAGDEKGSTWELEFELTAFAMKTTGSTLGTHNMADALAG